MVWNKGNKTQYEHTCLNCKIQFKSKVKTSQFHNKACKASFQTKGRKASEESRIKMSLAKTKDTIFAGFKTSLKTRIRRLQEYNEWRHMVFGRDEYTCQKCGKRGCYLEAHHIKSFKDIIEQNKINTLQKAKQCKELWDISNGITYCSECHIFIDGNRRGRGKKMNKKQQEMINYG